MTRALDTAKIQQNSGGSVAPFIAGKNKIINGDFSVWQRGTTFNSVSNGAFTADRWQVNWDSSPTVNVTQQTFTPGTAPVAGYEGAYFLRLAETAVSSSTVVDVRYRMEDVRTFAGQTATLSFWAKADSNRTLTIAAINQDFGTGGSTAVVVTPTISSFNLTTSWQRFTTTMTFPSIAGKTIGSNSLVSVFLRNAASSSLVFDLWGVQWEAGNQATPFTTATGTIQGELAACQRYYQRWNATVAYGNFFQGMIQTSSFGQCAVPLKVPMRVGPTTIDYSGNIALLCSDNSAPVPTSLTLGEVNPMTCVITINNSSNNWTTGRVGNLRANNDANAYIGLSAEL